MSDLTIACSSCGGELQITVDTEHFFCIYCGTELAARQAGGLVSLAPIVGGIEHVGARADKAASEQAIRLLTLEIAEMEDVKRHISTDPKQVRQEAQYRLLTPGEWLAVILAAVLWTVGLSLGLYASSLPTAESKLLAYVLAVVAIFVGTALAVMFSIPPERKRSSLVKQEVSRRVEEIARLEQQIAAKKEEIRKQQELLSVTMGTEPAGPDAAGEEGTQDHTDQSLMGPEFSITDPRPVGWVSWKIGGLWRKTVGGGVTAFEGIVRGYSEFRLPPGLGAVVVSVTVKTEIPLSRMLRRLGPMIRAGDNLKVARAVGVVGAARACQDLADALTGQVVVVTLGDEGQARIQPIGKPAGEA